MTFNAFKDAIEFQKKYGTMFLILSGGEPTEHPDFKNFLLYALNELPYCMITVTTNGVWMQSNEDFVQYILEKYDKRAMFQVTSVPEYYPVQINTALPVFSLSNVVVCTKIEAI
jgi:MoaA/NifB/PqqE/SkfB family radical SAM enzyme